MATAAELQEQLMSVLSQIENSGNDGREIDYEIEAMERKIAALKAERKSAMNRHNDLRAQQRKIETGIAEAIRFEAVAAETERQRQKTLEDIKSLDERTENATWRSRAKTHQIDGAHFLASAKRAIVADDMGTGKTLQSLMTCDMLGAKKVLVICPGEIMLNFQEECNKWSPERAALTLGKLDGAEWAFMMQMLAMRDEFFCIINFEAWRSTTKPVIKNLIALGFDTVIIDEAHNIKETDTSAFEGVSSIVYANNACNVCNRLVDESLDCVSCGHITHRVPSVVNVFPMTGTPILNRPDEIFPLLNLVNRDLFQSRAEFNRNFCVRTADNKWKFALDGEARLARLIGGFYIRRTMADTGVELPKQGVTIHEISLDPVAYRNQADLLEMLYDGSCIELDDETSHTELEYITLILRLRQAASWAGGIKLKVYLYDDDGNPIPVLDENGNPSYDKKGDPEYEYVLVPIPDRMHESQKLDRAVEIIREANEVGHRVVVFSQFSTALEEMQRRLGERTVSFTGATKPADRFAIKRNFNREIGEAPKWDNVLLNYKTGGVGLNLTAATVVVILDEEWNDGKSEQAYRRVNRMGQTEETIVHVLRLRYDWEGCRDADDQDIALDQWMASLKDEKAALVKGFSNEMTLVDSLKAKFGK